MKATTDEMDLLSKKTQDFFTKDSLSYSTRMLNTNLQLTKNDVRLECFLCVKGIDVQSMSWYKNCKCEL